MVKIEQIDINFTNDKIMYNPGDDVTGTISLHAEKEVKMKGT